MTYNTNAADILDRIAAQLEAKLQPAQPIRTYTTGPDGKCRLDLKEVELRLEQAIDQLPKNWRVE